MQHVTINVAHEYSSHPLGRERGVWPYGGERFREDFLQPRLHDGAHVRVDLRGVKGLAPSFLEEAFGGLIEAGFSYDFLQSHLEVVADNTAHVRQVLKYIRAAAGLPADD